MYRKGEMSFEEALAGLEKSAEILKKDGTSLEAAMESFGTGDRSTTIIAAGY